MIDSEHLVSGEALDDDASAMTCYRWREAGSTR
jgi:hypothetical protein